MKNPFKAFIKVIGKDVLIQLKDNMYYVTNGSYMAVIPPCIYQEFFNYENARLYPLFTEDKTTRCGNPCSVDLQNIYKAQSAGLDYPVDNMFLSFDRGDGLISLYRIGDKLICFNKAVMDALIPLNVNALIGKDSVSACIAKCDYGNVFILPMA